MSNGEHEQQFDFSVDRDNLYREEGITDIKVASIRRLVPINIDGTEDTNRPPVFMAHTQLMSPEGPVPLQAALKAVTIEEAIDEFPDAMQKALNDVVQKLKEMRKQQAEKQNEDSRIIVPGK
jgi:hypothetical protein